MALEKLDFECLREAMREGSSAWRPWKGVYGRARRLCELGYLLEAGISAMPPHVVYVVSDKGKTALSIREASQLRRPRQNRERIDS